MSKILIAYYSRTGENYVSGQIKTLKTGNTAIAAGIIQQLTAGDLFQIEQATPYSQIYNECIEQARADQNRDARPALKNCPDTLGEYDVIYLGYPNYWNTMPMAVFTFLEQYDFTGKVIRPFCTHEGSGLGSSIQDIRKLCPKAAVTPGLALRGGNAEHSRQEIESWLQEGQI